MVNNKAKTNINIGTLNCRSILRKRTDVAEDFVRFNLLALTTQETRIKRHGAEYIKTTTGKTLIHYYSGNDNDSKNGVGIIVDEKTQATFTPVDDRLCLIKIKTEGKQTRYMHHISLCTTHSTEKKRSKSKRSILRETKSTGGENIKQKYFSHSWRHEWKDR